MNQKGEVLEEAHPKSEQAIKKSSANELTSMLMGVIARGTGTGANIGRPAAGKTGTTDNYQDAWFVGYVPDLVAGVWVGCDDNSRMGNMTGGTTPAAIWKAFMSKVVQSMPNKNFSGAYLTPSSDKPVASDKEKDKDAKDKDGKDTKKDAKNQQQTNGNNAGGQSAPQAPDAAPAPAAPAPVPGAGGKKAN